VWQVRLQTARILYFTSYRQNWLQFLFVVKAAALKQQTFYPHIIGTEASYLHIYTSHWPVINAKAIFSAQPVIEKRDSNNKERNNE